MAEPHYSQGDILFSCAVDPATGAITNNAKARAPSNRPLGEWDGLHEGEGAKGQVRGHCCSFEGVRVSWIRGQLLFILLKWRKRKEEGMKVEAYK